MQIFCISHELRDFSVSGKLTITELRLFALVSKEAEMLCRVISSTLAAITQLRPSACLPLPSSIFHPAQQILFLSPFLAKPVINQGAIKLPKVY